MAHTLSLAFSHLVKVVLFTLISQHVASSVDFGRNVLESAFESTNSSQVVMKRAADFSNRALWLVDRKFMFPKGTVIQVTPQINLPAVRRKPYKGGLDANMEVSWTFYVILDKMGLTHAMHPWPLDFPPYFPFSSKIRPIGDSEEEMQPAPNPKKKPQKHPMAMNKEDSMEDSDENDMGKLLKNINGFGKLFPFLKPFGGLNHRQPRSIMSLPPSDNFADGGDRVTILPRFESLLANLGFEGRDCMLRAICEIHEYPLKNGYGLIGEIVSLVFSVSESPYAESHMPEYLKAEMAGRGRDCSAYVKLCSKSIFKWEAKRRQSGNAGGNRVPLSSRSKQADYDEL